MRGLGAFPGFTVVESPHLLDGPFEDWSCVRSPSRAARRRRQGHRQRIQVYYLPSKDLVVMGSTIYGHPDTIAALRKATEERKA